MKFISVPLAALLLALSLRAALAQVTRFQHVVIIVQENRTPDNLFFALCSPPFASRASCSSSPTTSQYNIQTDNWLNKASSAGITHPKPVPLASNYDLSHSHAAFIRMCDADSSGTCRMDGGAGVACSGSCPKAPQFRFVDNSTGILNPYLEFATQYGWANYMFSTQQGPSLPGHQFIFGGTSAPTAIDDAAGIFVAGNGHGGCVAPPGSTVQLITPEGQNESIYPCFEHETIPDVLPPPLTWRYYAPTRQSVTWNAPLAIAHICQSSRPGGRCTGVYTQDFDPHPSDILTDIAGCNLRSVSWVIPSGQNSDHPKGNDGGGPSWVASIVNTIGASTTCDDNTGYWNNTAILITWDDWGGWYDHEPPAILPGVEGDFQRGFRVPLIVVSAHTPAGYISNQRYDFGSVLRFVEQNFGIPEGVLNFADARSTSDLTDFFDFSAQPRQYDPISAPKSVRFFLDDNRPLTDPDDD